MIDMRILEKIMAEQLTAEHFEALLAIMDRLHDAAAVDQLHRVSTLDTQQILGWLDDIIFTAEETMRELQGHALTDETPWSDN
ncbi:MAG: hypothetical protein ACLFTK_05730 [Anaerolineales bacterium]